ncbi:hypothetical protein BDV96DRAFT_571286 [Lophiotrema nucula]|uniref:Protein kinase domain-containing protein n=1 Tax=Lophiotrema nucula TaxID=690887 RepID=A0A6A5ZEV3_9PLEO|nr:hypothetical protein BDV96DRAFT_571286 [Lophiotrema nucula]
METPEYLPSISVQAAVFGPDESYIVAVCMGTRFDIEVRADNLQGSPYLDEYIKLAAPLDNSDFEDDEDAVEALLDWVYRPLRPRFQALTPIDPHTITLQRSFFPPSIHVEVVVLDGVLTAKPVDDREMRWPTEGMIEWRESYASPYIPRIKASDLTVVAAHHNDNPTCDVPQRVRTKDGILRFFKDCTNTSQILRELEIASRIWEQGLYENLRISRVHGIAMSDDDNYMLGLVLDLIRTEHGNLNRPELKSQTHFHAKWAEQVRHIITVLHANDIVWGDVHPGNIVIDRNDDAWVVDFGGGYIEGFVPRKLKETKKGDWEGFNKIFKEWIKN